MSGGSDAKKRRRCKKNKGSKSCRPKVKRSKRSTPNINIRVVTQPGAGGGGGGGGSSSSVGGQDYIRDLLHNRYFQPIHSVPMNELARYRPIATHSLGGPIADASHGPNNLIPLDPDLIPGDYRLRYPPNAVRVPFDLPAPNPVRVPDDYGAGSGERVPAGEAVIHDPEATGEHMNNETSAEHPLFNQPSHPNSRPPWNTVTRIYQNVKDAVGSTMSTIYGANWENDVKDSLGNAARQYGMQAVSAGLSALGIGAKAAIGTAAAGGTLIGLYNVLDRRRRRNADQQTVNEGINFVNRADAAVNRAEQGTITPQQQRGSQTQTAQPRQSRPTMLSPRDAVFPIFLNPSGQHQLARTRGQQRAIQQQAQQLAGRDRDEAARLLGIFEET